MMMHEEYEDFYISEIQTTPGKSVIEVQYIPDSYNKATILSISSAFYPKIGGHSLKHILDMIDLQNDLPVEPKVKKDKKDKLQKEIEHFNRVKAKVKSLTWEQIVKQLKELHTPTTNYNPNKFCVECANVYPCATVKLLNEM